jgi:hypothetical protein
VHSDNFKRLLQQKSKCFGEGIDFTIQFFICVFTTVEKCWAMTKESFFNSMSLIIIGLGIGWLAGLSVTPVIVSIIVALFGVIAPLIAILVGVTPKNEQRINLLPIALLIVGLALGSILGIFTRTHNWLGVVTNTPNKAASTPHASPSDGVLFGDEHDECERLLTYDDSELPKEVEYSIIERFNDLPNLIKDSKILRKVLENQCAKLKEAE